MFKLGNFMYRHVIPPISAPDITLGKLLFLKNLNLYGSLNL
jgi:hypothetical protein